MVSLLLSLTSVTCIRSLNQAMITLAFCVPFSLSLLYKTNSMHEDFGFLYTSVGGPLVFLSVSLLALILLARSEVNSDYYTMMQVLLTVLLVSCFTSTSLLGFYIFFEACLIPIMLMIIHWGYQPERLQATMYMVMYTVVGSMPLLLIIFYINYQVSTFHLMSLFNFMVEYNILLLLGVLAFLVKLPVYGVHIWLPKAHVEAPLGGSMVLAGVLLKLGGYGMFLYSGVLHMNWNNMFSLLLMFISLWGGVLASVVCLSQADIKAMIAYSSIVHMSFMVMGLLSNSSWGLFSAVVIMVAHGWTSAALFLLAFETYHFVGSRSFNYTKGVLAIMPVLSTWWFIMAMANMGFPPTLNFMGEILIIPVSNFYSWKVFVPVGLIMFMSVAYNMYMYCQINHGSVTHSLTCGKMMSSRSLLALSGHLLPMTLLVNLYLFMGS
nr:NADH dehydrogenase subunit 4 [Candidula unifasciata unifasciata]